MCKKLYIESGRLPWMENIILLEGRRLEDLLPFLSSWRLNCACIGHRVIAGKNGNQI